MFRFTRDDSIEAGLRNIALSQIDLALAEIDAGATDAGTTIHHVRRRCKKLRGLIRLVRPVFPNYARENVAIRDAALGLSQARDAQVMVETFDRYVGKDRGLDGPFAATRRALAEGAGTVAGDGGAALLPAFREILFELRGRAAEWTVTKDGFAAVRGGLADAYRSARRRMIVARKQGDAAHFHDWRKAVKAHAYHAALLREMAPDLLPAHRKLADRLGETLGEHHNLAVLRSAARKIQAGGGEADAEPIEAAIGGEMETLEAEAFALGRQLLAETTPALTGRFERYWRGWR